MKLNVFSSGKSKGKKKPLQSAAASSQIAGLESQLSDWTDSLNKTEQRLKKLSSKVEEKKEGDSARPHGPIEELSLNSDESADDEKLEDEAAEEVNMFEVKNKPAESEAGTGAGDAAIRALFESDEEDENPLANLIRSLPEVTINELEDDLKEIKDIIKDWQKK